MCKVSKIFRTDEEFNKYFIFKQKSREQTPYFLFFQHTVT